MDKFRIRDRSKVEERAVDKAVEKREEIHKLKYEMETEGQNLPKEQQAENLKKIYAMEVLNDENTWLRLKCANDYTKEKIKDHDKNDADYRM